MSVRNDDVTAIGDGLSRQYIGHVDGQQKYAPPGHSGTVNVRLFDRSFCENFEMVLGRIEAGGRAERHHHDVEYQAIYVLSGCARVTLAEEDSMDCGPGSIIRIPPGLDHQVVAVGTDPLELIIVYSPPLPVRNDASVR